jgi:hypothetical protein
MRIVIVSNRLPVSITKDKKTITNFKKVQVVLQQALAHTLKK